MPNGVGVDESCIWGDYFYLESLMRVSRLWTPYW
jgi:unsaturated chondroitin disaccharide hydrolase